MAYIKTGYLKNNAGALLTTIFFPEDFISSFFLRFSVDIVSLLCYN